MLQSFPYSFTALYFILCVVYVLLGANRRKQWQKALLKCLPIGLLLFEVAWNNESEPQQLPGDQGGNSFHHLLLGLSFSMAGDALLVFRGSLGLIGILSFALAQCVYILLFGLSIERVVEQSYLGLLSGLGVLCLSLTILLVFGWRFTDVLKTGDHGMRRRFIGLVLPLALVYFILISFMLWSAILQLQEIYSLSNILGAIGGFLFYVSDVLIAAGAIWQLRVLLHGRILVMATYYSAQFLITLSIVL